ncbi:MAG: HdaA/DnaA family protein [Dichotomicrobium sp.]
MAGEAGRQRDRQLALDLPHVPALDADDFMVSDCNADAMRLIESWPDWSARCALIAGPAGAGKSHLVNVWRGRSRAKVLSAAALEEGMVDAVDAAPLALEDVDRFLRDERALFHLLNLSRERGFDILLTARSLPGAWPIGLGDLRSRLRSLPFAQIGAPDDALLRAVLVKLFDDRQLSAPPPVIDYLLRRMERSVAAAADLVARMDKAALAERRRITPRFAARFVSAETR